MIYNFAFRAAPKWVILYFCKELFGLPGMVISIKPYLRAGFKSYLYYQKAKLTKSTFARSIINLLFKIAIAYL